MEIETIIRLCTFFGVFGILATAEFFVPRRRLEASKSRRWFTNLTIVALNPLAVALIFPVFPVGVALLATEQNWGLLNQLDLPYWVEVIIAVAAMDFAVYTQHVIHHAIPLLWRLHMIHHADLDIDMTTGLRFHPIEIIVSMAIKLSAVAALGASPLAVLIFEVALNATSMFNHSNLHIPEKLDRILRLIVVTPDMHRVHHSVIIR
jgi:sterol desaturase/sphingolipid hydroxylase (fatty acid hydroxylase superfamily)